MKIVDEKEEFLKIQMAYKVDLMKYIEQGYQEQYNATPYFQAHQLKQDHFVNDNFFNAGIRRCSKDEHWFLLLKNLLLLEGDNGSFGGFITNICYRLMENLDDRKFIIRHLMAFKVFYDANVVLDSAISSRWFVSSSNVLGSILLMNKNIKDAEMLFSNTLDNISKIPYNSLYLWNLSMIYYQYAMIFVYQGNTNKAIQQFEACFLNGKGAIGEIYHPRNNYFLSMFIDCENMLKLSKFSIIGVNALKDETYNEISVFKNIRMNKRLRFNALLPIQRFEDLSQGNIKWYKEVQAIINKKLLDG